MKRSARLMKLLSLEESRERDEARRLADSQRLLNERRIKLTELDGYLGDYLRQFDAAARTGTPSAQARSSHEFINHLRGVIGQQQQAVAEAEQGVAARRADWLEAKQQVDVLRKTIEKLDLEDAVRDRKQEQALADEAAQRTFNRR